jgi:hypothetical protein
MGTTPSSASATRYSEKAPLAVEAVVWLSVRVLGTCANGKLTAFDDTRDALADGPQALRNIWSKFINDARKIVTYDYAILALLE